MKTYTTRYLKPSFASLLSWLSLPMPFAQPIGQSATRLHPGLLIGCSLMINVLSLALPVMMLQIYDRIIPNQAFGTFAFLAFGVITALSFEAILRVLRAYLTAWSAATYEHRMNCAAVKHFTHVHLTEFERLGGGIHLQNLQALGKLREFYSGQAFLSLIDLPFVAIFLLMMGYIGGWLVLISLGLLIGFLLVARTAGQRLRAALERRSKADDGKFGFVMTLLTGIHTIKAQAMEASLLRRFEKRQSEATLASHDVAMASGVSATLAAAFGQLSLILIAGIGSVLVVHGELTVGGLSACTLLAGRVIQPVQRVLGTWLRMQDLNVSHARAQSLFEMPVRPLQSENPPEPEGRVGLRQLSFGYQPDQLLLDAINLSVEPGEIIAISGDKGSGKSTLLQLIAGVVAPTEGEIRLDNFDPAQHSMASLRHHVGYLPQQGSLFKGTILENLTGFRNDDRSIMRAKEAAQEFGLESIVALLPRGYETKLTDGPADPIPPGVRQRVALARVLANRPKVLLFDDADRALDKEGYNRLFKLMGRMKQRCTILMVSHDLNLLSFADRHYHLSQGKLTRQEQSREAGALSLPQLPLRRMT